MADTELSVGDVEIINSHGILVLWCLMATVKLGLEGPSGPGQGLCRWPLQAPHGKGSGKFQTLWSLASRSRRRARSRARAPQEPKGIQRFCCIALKNRCEKCFRMHWSNQFFAVNLLKNKPKQLLTSIPTMSSSTPWLKLPQVSVAADSKLCFPLASFRFRRIPNLASLLAVPLTPT